MSGLYWICPIWGQICLVQQDNTLWKSRTRAKIMNLGPHKLTTYKQDTIELVEIRGPTRDNPNNRN
jgi:hypothetical protein